MIKSTLNLIRILLNVTLICSNLIGFSQHIGVRHYGIKDGLPTNEIYHVMQDSKGYIWVSTDYGVCKYDGKEFSIFTVKDGLPNNIAFETYEDKTGKIWCRTLSKKMVYFLNDTIVKFNINQPMLQDLDVGFWKFWTAMNEDENCYRFFVSKVLFLEVSKNDNSVQRLVHIPCTQSDEEFVNINQRPTFHFCKEDSLLSKQNLVIHKQKMSLKHLPKYHFPFLSTIKHHNLFFINDSLSLFNTLKEVWLIKNGKTILANKKTDAIILSISRLNKESIAINTRQGTYLVDASDLSETNPKLFQEHEITSVTYDKEGGMWISSLFNGLFYIANPSLLKQNQPVLSIENETNEYLRKLSKSKDGRFLHAIFFDCVNKLWDNENNRIKLPEGRSSNLVGNCMDAAFFNDRIYVAKANYHIFSFQIDSTSLVQSSPMPSTLKLVENHEDSLFISMQDGVYRFKTSKEIKQIIKLPLTTCLTSSSKGLFIGNFGNLYNYQNGIIKQLIPEFLKDEVTAVAIDSNNYTWVATKGDGLFVLDELDELKYHITTQKNGLLSNFCTSLCIDSIGDIWVGSNKGLQRIEKGDYFIQKSSLTYDTNQGLPSNQVNDIAFYQSKLWIGTLNGIMVLDPKMAANKPMDIPVYITKILINDTLNLKDISSFNVNYNQNTVEFNFTKLGFKNPYHPFQYRLLERDTNWISTNNSSVRFLDLPPGKYQFQVRTKNTLGNWNKEISSMCFIISPAFWQTVWFWSIIGVVAALLLGLLMHWRFKRLHIKAKLNEALMAARHQALNAQMNPHFVFNSLNAINSYILQNDPIKASRFLGKFSSLVRGNLENSFNDLVSLEKELDLLKNYLELEQLRCDNKFDYHIEAEQNVDLEQTLLPPLLLQPYLENSIWHGFAGIKYQGKLNISIKQQDEYTHINITDNGIGRKKTRNNNNNNNNNNNHVSRGTMITNRRLDLAHMRYRNKFEVSMDDLHDESGKSVGTRVQLWLGNYTQLKHAKNL